MKKRSHDYPKFIGPLHELVSFLSHTLETSERSYSGRATRFFFFLGSFPLARASARTCVLSDRECSRRIMGMTRPAQSSAFYFYFFFFFLFFFFQAQVRLYVGYVDIVSSKGLTLAHLEATTVAISVLRII